MNKILILFCFLGYSSALFAQKSVSNPTFVLPGHENDIRALATTTAGNLFASGGWDRKINLYQLADSVYTPVTTIPDAHNFPISALCFSRDGKILASGSNDNTIKVWDSLYRQVRVLEGHTGKIGALLIDPFKKYVISGSEDRQIKLWEIKTGKNLKTIDNMHAVNAFALGTDNRSLFVAGNEPFIKVYTIGVWTVAKTFTGHSDIVNAIALSSDGKYMLSGSNDKTARLWDLKTGKEIRRFAVDCWKVQTVAFTRDNRHAATGCNDGSVKIWEVETGKLVASISAENENVQSLVFNQKAEHVLLANALRGKSDYGIRVWPTFISKKEKALPADSTKKATPATPGTKKPTTPVKPKSSGK